MSPGRLLLQALLLATLGGCATVSLTPAQVDRLTRLQALADDFTRDSWLGRMHIKAGDPGGERLGYIWRGGLLYGYEVLIRPELLETDCADLVVASLLARWKLGHPDLPWWLSPLGRTTAEERKAVDVAVQTLAARGWRTARIRLASEECVRFKATLTPEPPARSADE